MLREGVVGHSLFIESVVDGTLNMGMAVLRRGSVCCKYPSCVRVNIASCFKG